MNSCVYIYFHTVSMFCIFTFICLHGWLIFVRHVGEYTKWALIQLQVGAHNSASRDIWGQTQIVFLAAVPRKFERIKDELGIAITPNSCTSSLVGRSAVQLPAWWGEQGRSKGCDSWWYSRKAIGLADTAIRGQNAPLVGTRQLESFCRSPNDSLDRMGGESDVYCRKCQEICGLKQNWVHSWWFLHSKTYCKQTKTVLKNKINVWHIYLTTWMVIIFCKLVGL